MRNLSKNILGLWLIGMGLGVGAGAQAATGVGPYYAMPAWDQTLPAATRFIVLTNMGSAAVLDRETGLVWEQSPDTTFRNWQDAQIHCVQLNLGGRKGWRPPTIQELASLVDPAFIPSLPSGHPFTVQSFAYWSASTLAGDTTSAWGVDFGNTSGNNGFVGNIFKVFEFRVWCVRGGQGPDGQ